MSTWKELYDNPRLLEIVRLRAEIIKIIRQFFWAQGFLETDVPVAVRVPSQEPYLHFIPIAVHDHVGKQEQFYLTTSPEFSLKKLLAAGLSRIFYIAKCFRDYEEFGRTHNTEFTMIEWYRAPGVLVEIMDDVEKLCAYIGRELKKEELSFGGKKISLTGPWERVTMKELWQHHVNVDLDLYLESDSLKKLVRELGYQVEEHDAYEDLFFKVFLNKIEPHLGGVVPTFVYKYPQQLCSLSRLCDDDARYAERFELYVGGLEVANAFGELTDPVEQKKRLIADRDLRKKLGKEAWVVDQDLIEALEVIDRRLASSTEDVLKQVAGIALGIDRMVVLFTGAHDINEVIFQSMADQIGSVKTEDFVQ